MASACAGSSRLKNADCIPAVAHGECASLCRVIAASTVSGTLQLVRFGMTLASQPILNIYLIDDCAALVMAHVQLPDSDSDVPAQVCRCLLPRTRKMTVDAHGLDNSERVPVHSAVSRAESIKMSVK
jgi:hypothetical protein